MIFFLRNVKKNENVEKKKIICDRSQNAWKTILSILKRVRMFIFLFLTFFKKITYLTFLGRFVLGFESIPVTCKRTNDVLRKASKHNLLPKSHEIMFKKTSKICVHG